MGCIESAAKGTSSVRREAEDGREAEEGREGEVAPLERPWRAVRLPRITAATPLDVMAER